MKDILILLAIAAFFTAAQADSSSSDHTDNHFIVEVKVLIYNKSIYSTNISLFKDNLQGNTSLQYNLSSIHLKRAVSASVRLLAWYNGYWVQRNQIAIKLTDKRSVYKETNHLLSKLLKYKSRNILNQMYILKEDSILKKGKVLVSYDAQSSLLVSRLEDIQNCNDESMYVPLASLSPFQTKQTFLIVLQFSSIIRSDDFIEARNFISNLNSIQNKVKDMISLVTVPIPQEEIQPYNIYRSIFNNFQNLMKNTKKYKQKQNIIKGSRHNHILIPYVEPLISDQRYSQIFSYLPINFTKTNDTLIATYNYVIRQVDTLDTIYSIKNTAKKTSFNGYFFDYRINDIAHYEVLISYFLGALWILMDLFNLITKTPYVSSAFVFYLKRWFFFQIILQCFKVGSIAKYYYGIAFFFLYLIIERLIAYKLENKKQPHLFTNYDDILTEYTFNLIVLAMTANVVLHLFYYKDIRGTQIIFWSFSQAKSLITQYYYVLAMIPSIMLTFKYKSTQHIGFPRLILLFLISIKDNYWILLDDNMWIRSLYLKEQIVVVILLLLSLIYGSKAIRDEEKGQKAD